MSRRYGLLSTLLLVLATGCNPAPGKNARSDGPKPAADIAASVAAPANEARPLTDDATVAVDHLRPADLAVAGDESARSLDLPPSNDAAPDEPFPAEVTSFMVDRDGCDHFRGEEPYDAERRAYLEDSIAELCTGTDARLAGLRSRYAQEPAVIAALRGYEDKIEGKAP